VWVRDGVRGGAGRVQGARAADEGVGGRVEQIGGGAGRLDDEARFVEHQESLAES
jgi:hypothetical protein